MPTPNSKVNVLLNALTSTPAPSPSILPSEMCFTVVGLRRHESLVSGVFASREEVWGAEDVLKPVSRSAEDRGARKGSEKPRRAEMSRTGRARMEMVAGRRAVEFVEGEERRVVM